MAFIVDNTNGIPAPSNYCLPIIATHDTVVSDDNCSRSDSPLPEPVIVLLTPKKKHDESEQERDPRRISRIPCKARGVIDASVPHTARNAYIDIPDNAVHGMMLICSHDICAKSRRFRYCTVCGIPVAKRNFLKRHGHGLLKARQRVLVPEESPSSIDERPTKRPRASADPPPLPLCIEPTSVSDQPNLALEATDGSVLMKVSPEERRLLEHFRLTPGYAEPLTRNAMFERILASANRTPPTPTSEIEPPMQFVITDEVADDSSVDEFIGKWFLEM